MPLTDEQRQRIREEEIERLRVRRELGGDPRKTGDVPKTLISWVVLIAVAVLLWRVVKSSHSY